MSDKDQGYASTVDAGERTRDVLSAIYGSVVATEKVGAAAVVATEKTGAASVLATEKIGAGGILATEKTGAAGLVETIRSTQLLQVQGERNFANTALQAERIRTELAAQAERYQIANTMAMSDMRLEQQKQSCEVLAAIAKCCCEDEKRAADLKATILAAEANRVRDDLAQCRAELLAFRASGNGNGNNGNNRV